MARCVKRKKRKKLPIVIAALLLFAALCFLYVRLTVSPILKTVSAEEIRAITTNAVNEAVLKVLEETPAYADMVVIGYDNENNINSIRVKASVVNALVQKSTMESQERISDIGMQGIDIPLGSLSGIMSLAGKGPDINLKVVPVGSVTAQLCSEFKAAGINQTNHRIYLKLSANVSIIVPGSNNVVNTVTEVMIIDSIIVGKIPDTYLNSTSTQDMMDLIP